MLKLLIKRQLSELFRGYFYNQKTNKARSRAGTIGMIVMFVLLTVGMVGGLMTMMSMGLCAPLTGAGLGWLYFAIMGLLALFLGLIGGVFTAYSSLYQAKDNDFLMSLPIPAAKIITARILAVYLMCSLFSLLVILPALVVYWVETGPSVGKIVGGLLFALAVTLLALVLSGLLGYVVARISTKLKNKSIVTVLISLAGIGLYYFFYFRFQMLVQRIATDPEAFARLESVPGLKPFGEAALPRWICLAGLLVITLVLLGLVLLLLVRSFSKVISNAAVVSQKAYKAKRSEQKSVWRALLGKETGRFTGSPGYMLNAGLGSVFLILLGGSALWKGRELVEALQESGSGLASLIGVLACAALTMMAGFNTISTPSVSLEGKQLWIVKSLPVEARDVLKAKLALHLLVTGVPLLFASVCFAIVIKPSLPVLLLLIFLPQMYLLFAAGFGLMMGLLRPNFNWTNEMVPIKQSLSVLLSMFGGLFYAVVLGGLYLWVGKRIGPVPYLALAAAVTLLLDVLVVLWLRTRGVKRFEAL